MSEELIQVGQVHAHYNAAGTKILKYSVEIYHEGLKEYKSISAPDTEILQNKVDLQENKWIEKWEMIEAKCRLQEEKEANLENAENRTDEAQASLKQIDNLPIHTLSIDDTVDWENLKKNEKFEMAKPPKPDKNSVEFIPQFNLFEILFDAILFKLPIFFYESMGRNYPFSIHKSKKQQKRNEYELKYINAVKNWEKENHEWEKESKLFYHKQKEFNRKIDLLKALYFNKDVNSVTEYCEMVLNNSEYPDTFPKNFEIEYNPLNEILVVEYQLPARECFPIVKEVKYIATKKELRESNIPESQLMKMFDDAMYKITLRTIHELFEADTANALTAVSFNGWVKDINKATGKKENNCILSIQVNKDEFMQIELANVDPKICFKNLKGVASSKLSSLTPIQPILQISKTDKRFIDSYDVADTIDNATNIAAMYWKDFEHLIREIFEKEFSTSGGEVKITQASRDGGVDAIAFDPDPIRGGKIVIQAKRYTNTVGVSAVRDLYGTVVNEGAIKGILITTADYGSDAYNFAKNKPLALLNGSNLLHMLGKHGHHAKIDLKEAKKMLDEKDN